MDAYPSMNLPMSLDLDTLHRITQSKTYNQLPLTLAQRKEGAKWWQMQEAVSEESARLQVWEAAQYIALLFDTYPGLIQDVRLSLNLADENGAMYADNYTYINDESAHDQAPNLLSDERDAIDEIDDARVLWAVVDTLNDVATMQLAAHVEILREAFGRKITSAEQARQIGRELGGAMAAHIEAEVLEQVVGPAPGRSGGPRL